ncbi:hypothetical protein K523DRAFT_247121 [Schizophyllum commune Tattone D]|nr:hypothetical protein K525DRAFT_244241 [Schizophyllum commune Loenen D]KAI5827334.1 hypothetical protein K523DRAFT_247121 [Schizophyllum commune Tattone D]
MLQCYAGEARRFTLTRTLDIHTGRVSWHPRDKIHVSGWTRYIKGKAVARSLNGRKAARLLYASMYTGAQDVFLKLQKVRNVHNRLLGQRPEPDARFFNAALDAFSRPRDRGRPVVSWASKPLSAFAARCQLRSAMQKYDQLQKRPACSRELGQVMADMQKAGYAIPVALRPLLVGRMPVERISWEGIARVDRAPYAFPRRRRSCKRRTHRIPVSKTKGLPLSRMSVGRRMRQRRDTQRS